MPWSPSRPSTPLDNSLFADLVAPVEPALAQERTVTEQVNGLLRIAEAGAGADTLGPWGV